MKPSVLATADRLSMDWPVQPRVLRFAPRQQAIAEVGPSSFVALIWAWLLVALVPLFWGRAIALALDEPLLGVVAGMLALIPLMIGLCPRSVHNQRA